MAPSSVSCQRNKPNAGASRSNSSDSLRSVSSQSEDGEEESDTAAEPIPALSIPGADLLPPPPEMKAKTPTRAEITEEPTSKDEGKRVSKNGEMVTMEALDC